MIKCYFDGACEPVNPGGNMGIGAIILKDNVAVFKHAELIPPSSQNSSNVAEYMALEKILQYIRATTLIEQKIFIYGDSKLVINQMGGSWRIKSGYYVEWALLCLDMVKDIEQQLKKILVFTWVPREANQVADDLSKEKLIKGNIPFKIQPGKNWLEIAKKHTKE